MAESKEELLEGLRRNKQSQGLSDVERVLAAWGWTGRKARKEASVWKKGQRTLTLPNPHGHGQKTLKLPYVVKVIGLIEADRDEQTAARKEEE